MKWKNQFNNHGRVHSGHGNRIVKKYGAVYDERGRIDLEEKGEENLYDYIQSFKDSVDIHVIMKRFENGETDILSRVQGFYGDYTNLPHDYASLLNTVNAGQTMFNDLPVEVRAKFGHDFNEFMTSLCDGTVAERLGYKEERPSPAIPDVPPAVEE